MLAEIGSSEALGELPEQDDGVQEGVSVLIGEAQAGGTLATCDDRAIDCLEGILAEDAIVAEALDLDKPAVGGKADLAQLGQIGQTFADPEVIGVVDRGLGAQGPVFLVVLPDPRALVIDVQRWGDVLGHDAGAESARRPAVILRLKMS